MVYKRPTDFIPRKPLRSSDDADESAELSMEDMLSALPQETSKARKAPDEIRPLDGLFSESSMSEMGRWASSSSLDYYHTDDEEVAPRKGRRKLKFDNVKVLTYEIGSSTATTLGMDDDDDEVSLDGFDFSEPSTSRKVQTSSVDDYEASRSTSSKPKRLSKKDRETRLQKPDIHASA